MLPVGLLTGSAKIEKNKITYAKDTTDTTGSGLQANLEYSVGYDSVKEDIVLDKYQQIDNLTFQIKLANVTYKEEEDGTIGFYDKNGKKKWFINRPYMTDSGKGYSDAVSMKVRQEGKNFYLDVKPNNEWLKDPARIYPIQIDPTITLQPDQARRQYTLIIK